MNEVNWEVTCSLCPLLPLFFIPGYLRISDTLFVCFIWVGNLETFRWLFLAERLESLIQLLPNNRIVGEKL